MTEQQSMIISFIMSGFILLMIVNFRLIYIPLIILCALIAMVKWEKIIK